MESVKRLDRVFPFNAKLSFLISHEWTEEYASGTLKYQEPGAKSGCLRVSLITSGTLNESACGYLKNSYAKKTNVTVEEKTGNLVSFYKKTSKTTEFPFDLLLAGC